MAKPSSLADELFSLSEVDRLGDTFESLEVDAKLTDEQWDDLTDGEFSQLSDLELLQTAVLKPSQQHAAEDTFDHLSDLVLSLLGEEAE